MALKLWLVRQYKTCTHPYRRYLVLSTSVLSILLVNADKNSGIWLYPLLNESIKWESDVSTTVNNQSNPTKPIYRFVNAYYSNGWKLSVNPSKQFTHANNVDLIIVCLDLFSHVLLPPLVTSVSKNTASCRP